MNMNNPDLSLAFYDYLCNVIGTEDVVNTRRCVFTAYDHGYGRGNTTWLCSGSKAEGLDLDGSDFDLMYVLNDFPVYESKDDFVQQLSEPVPFVMDTTDCKLGFTQLKLFNRMSNKRNANFCENKAGEFFFSSSMVKDGNKARYRTSIIHGPCISNSEGTYDFALCLRCEKFISQAKPWILRLRHSWASNDVINSILQFGVLFVPIGCKNSPNIDLEWRISFSYAEKLLIWSFNHVQLLCYALLKILLKEIIKDTTGDLLCSYFLKTVMLWICEETKLSQWKANQITSSFTRCFNRLIYCVKYKTCAHYFIPENDLFAERFDKQQHCLLLSTLNQLKSLGWSCLLHTNTLMSFKKNFVPDQSPMIHKDTYLDSLYFARVMNTFEKERGKRLAHIINICMRSNNKDFLIDMISDINKYIGHSLSEEDKGCNNNKQAYNIYRKRLCHLVIGLNHDAVSGWLVIASFFFVNKQYQICTKILLDCLFRCTRDKILISQILSKDDYTHFILWQKKLGLQHLNLTKKFIIGDVILKPSSLIFLEEMRILDVQGTLLHIPPLVFGLFLAFLSYHNLGDDHKKDESLRALEIVIQNQYFISGNNQLDNAHKLLSIHYMKCCVYFLIKCGKNLL